LRDSLNLYLGNSSYQSHVEVIVGKR